MLGNIFARNMHQETLIKMELQEMEMSNHRNMKGDGNTLLRFLWAKHEQTMSGGYTDGPTLCN